MWCDQTRTPLPPRFSFCICLVWSITHHQLLLNTLQRSERTSTWRWVKCEGQISHPSGCDNNRDFNFNFFFLTLMARTLLRLHILSVAPLWYQWAHRLLHKAATRWVTETAAAVASPGLSLSDQTAPYFILPLRSELRSSRSPRMFMDRTGWPAHTCIWMFWAAAAAVPVFILQFYSCEPGKASEVRRLGGINKPVWV